MLKTIHQYLASLPFYPFMRRSVISAWQGLIRNLLVSVSTVLVIALIVLFFNTILAINIFTKSTIADVSKKVDIGVEIEKDADTFAVQSLLRDLEKNPNIAEIKYVSADEALNDFAKRHPDIKTFLTRYKLDNPLPATIGVISKDLSKNPEILTFLKNPTYDKVIVPEKITLGSEENKYAEKLIEITNFIKSVSGWLLLLFAVVTLLIILDAINGTISMRREEIEIMRLVGATHRFIRIPFLIEGAFIGIIAVFVSGALTLLVLMQLYSVMSSVISNPSILAAASEIMGDFSSSFSGIFALELLGAILFGSVISFLAIERFLQKSV